MLDPISTAAAEQLLKLGLPGLAILGLLWLYRSERIAHAATRARLDAVQDQRILDAREQTAAIGANTSATTASTQALRDLSALVMAGRHGP